MGVARLSWSRCLFPDGGSSSSSDRHVRVRSLRISASPTKDQRRRGRGSRTWKGDAFSVRWNERRSCVDGGLPAFDEGSVRTACRRTRNGRSSFATRSGERASNTSHRSRCDSVGADARREDAKSLARVKKRTSLPSLARILRFPVRRSSSTFRLCPCQEATFDPMRLHCRRPLASPTSTRRWTNHRFRRGLPSPASELEIHLRTRWEKKHPLSSRIVEDGVVGRGGMRFPESMKGTKVRGSVSSRPRSSLEVSVSHPPVRPSNDEDGRNPGASGRTFRDVRCRLRGDASIAMVPLRSTGIACRRGS